MNLNIISKPNGWPKVCLTLFNGAQGFRFRFHRFRVWLVYVYDPTIVGDKGYYFQFDFYIMFYVYRRDTDQVSWDYTQKIERSMKYTKGKWAITCAPLLLLWTQLNIRFLMWSKLNKSNSGRFELKAPRVSIKPSASKLNQIAGSFSVSSQKYRKLARTLFPWIGLKRSLVSVTMQAWVCKTYSIWHAGRYIYILLQCLFRAISFMKIKSHIFYHHFLYKTKKKQQTRRMRAIIQYRTLFIVTFTWQSLWGWGPPYPTKSNHCLWIYIYIISGTL